MNRSTPILAVLLLASLLANVLLGVRVSRTPEPVATPRGPSGGLERRANPEDLASLKASLEAERKKNEDLHARIDRLETDKKVLVQETPGAGAKVDKLAQFRVKLRKLKKMMSDPALKDGNGVDPDSMVELTDTMMEFMRMAALRSKEPKAYADYLQAFYEIGLEGEGTSLTPDQSKTLNTLLQGYGEALGQVPQTPAGDRLLKELLLESTTMNQVQALLSEQQRTALAKESMEVLASTNMMSTAYVTKPGARDQIAQQWSALYQLDATQLPQAKLAAQSYVDTMARLEAETKGGDPTFLKPGSSEAYDYRVQSVRAQLDALNLLQSSMTPAQVDRLRTQTMKELHIMDPNAQVQVTTPEK
jgi:hypothetical protein